MLDKPGTTGNAKLTTTIGLQWGIFVALAAAGVLAYAGTRVRAAHVREVALAEDPTVDHSVVAPDEAATRVRRTRTEAEQLSFDVPSERDPFG
jgi:hypothetical protein